MQKTSMSVPHDPMRCPPVIVRTGRKSIKLRARLRPMINNSASNDNKGGNPCRAVGKETDQRTKKKALRCRSALKVLAIPRAVLEPESL
jgi:hypothetical protein